MVVIYFLMPMRARYSRVHPMIRHRTTSVGESDTMLIIWIDALAAMSAKGATRQCRSAIYRRCRFNSVELLKSADF